jgi:hypothetical protein
MICSTALVKSKTSKIITLQTSCNNENLGCLQRFPSSNLSKQEAEHSLTSDKRIVHVTLSMSGQRGTYLTLQTIDCTLRPRVTDAI